MFCLPCSKLRIPFIEQIKIPTFGLTNITSKIFKNVKTRDTCEISGTLTDTEEAIKNLGEKAEGILEEQKKKVEELAIEKKNAAAAILEQQKEKIGDLLWQTKTDTENVANESVKQAVDGFEAEVSKETNRIVDDTLQQVSSTVDEKLKESEEVLEEKREEVLKSMSSASESVLNPSAVLGKAKGFLNF